MGLLVDGKWQDRWYDTADTGGRFVRTEAQFRNWVTADGKPGPTGEGGFAAEPGRYHLYVSLACPWAHRTLIFRKLKGLEKAIAVSVVHWLMGEHGWTFARGPGLHRRPAQRRRLPPPGLHAGRTRATPAASPCRCCGTSSGTRSSTTSSSEIIRMLNSAFDGVGALPGDYYPADLRAEIDALNAARLRHGQQRRLQGRLRHHAGGLRGGRPARCSRRLDWLEERLVTPALPRRRPHDRGRLAAVHDAGALRPGLCRPLQVQPAPHRRLPEPVGLPRATSTRGRASPRPSTSTTSSATTTGATDASTRPASCRWARSSTSPSR